MELTGQTKYLTGIAPTNLNYQKELSTLVLTTSSLNNLGIKPLSIDQLS